MTGLRDMAILVLRSAAFEFLAAGFVFSGYGLVRRFAGDCRPSVKWCVALLWAAYVATMAFHVLAAAGIFRLSAALALVAIGGLLVHRRVLPVGDFLRDVVRDARGVAGCFRARRADWRVLPLAVVAVCAVLAVAKMLLVPPLGWDALTYHCTKAALWIQNGTLETLRAPGGWSYFPLFAGGGEIPIAWVMLPFHSDLLVAFSGAAIWLGTGLAAYAIGRSLGLSRWAGSAAASFILFIPAMYRITGSGYVEPYLTLVTAVMALAGLLYTERREPFFLVTAMAAAGLMAGTKIMGLVLGASGALVLLAAAFADAGSRRAHLRAYLAGAALALLAVAPWWARAIAQTGCPLSPIPLEVFGIPLGRINPDLAWLQARPDTVSTWSREWGALGRLLIWDDDTPRLGPGVILPAVLAIPGVLMLGWRKRWSAAFCVAMIAGFFAAYLHPGMTVIRLNWETTNARYFIQIVPMVVTLSFLPLRASRAGTNAYAWVLAALTAWRLPRELMWGVAGITLQVLPWAAITLLLAAAGLALLALAGRVRASVVAALALPILVLPGLAVYRDVTRARVYAEEDMMRLHFVQRYWSDAAGAVDVPGRVARIAVTSAPWQNGDNWLLFPFLGRRFQNRIVYVPISEDGSVPSFDGTERYLDNVSPQAWLARLHELGMTHVMSFWPRSVEQMWMAENPALFEPVSVGDKWGFYRVRR